MNEKETFLKWKSNMLYYIVLAIFTGLIGYLSLGDGFDFNIYPIAQSGATCDVTFNLAIIKGISENGFKGIWFNSRIGAPEAASLIDFPACGNTMVLIIWIISCFTSNISQIMYIYLIISFVFDGISMSFLLKKLKIKSEISFVISCLFAFAPYHFYRYLKHMVLIDYASIPIALYLAFIILGIIEEPKKLETILCVILLGLGYGYYYAFGLVILAVAYLFKFIKLEEKKEIIKEIWIPALLLFTILVSNMPKIIYSLINGKNMEAGHRSFFEQELYGLKIINLLLPVSYSRINAFKELTNSYIVSGAPVVTENSWASLGIIGSVGFILLCGMLIFSFIKKKSCYGGLITDFCAFTTLVFVLVSTIGGFGEIFNWAITSQIRCWNRSSIVIAGLSYIMIAVLLNKMKYKRRMVPIILYGVILGIGCYDQIDIMPSNWQEESGIKQLHMMYEDYFADVEDSFEDGALVYQLPYLDFPEQSAFDYKHFIAYLFTDELRWSYGGMRGRNLVARELNIDAGMSYAFLAGLKKAGFQAVYIDLDGYDNEEQEQILAFYDSLGVNPIVSSDEKLYVYDISKVMVPEEYYVIGYPLIHEWAETYDIDVSKDMQMDVAERLYNSDAQAYEILYKWLVMDTDIIEAADDEYINYLYNVMLGREPEKNEVASWVETIQNGNSKENIFFSFLDSEEFKNRLEVRRY